MTVKTLPPALVREVRSIHETQVIEYLVTGVPSNERFRGALIGSSALQEHLSGKELRNPALIGGRVALWGLAGWALGDLALPLLPETLQAAPWLAPTFAASMGALNGWLSHLRSTERDPLVDRSRAYYALLPSLGLQPLEPAGDDGFDDLLPSSPPATSNEAAALARTRALAALAEADTPALSPTQLAAVRELFARIQPGMTVNEGLRILHDWLREQPSEPGENVRAELLKAWDAIRPHLREE